MMKKVFNKIRFILILCVLIYGFGFFAVRLWLGFRFETVTKDRNYKSFVSNIKKNKYDLPPKLHTAYFKVFNSKGNASTNYLLFKTPFRFFGFEVKSESCPCFIVNYGFVDAFWDRLTVGIQLDKDLGSSACLNYYLNHVYFGHNQTGIKNASNFYYNKSIFDLTEKEMIELCIMTINYSLYNKKDNPERLNKQLQEIL